MKSYHIITIGCQMNQADSERLSAYLEEHGFYWIDDFKKAEVVIFNTCGVRQSAEDRVYGLINKVSSRGAGVKIVITGCLSRRADVIKRLSGKVDIFLPISEIMTLPKLLSGSEFNPYFSLDEIRLEQGEKYLKIKPKYQSRFTAYVPIGNGCNNFCSYCVVPYARGREVYRPTSDILKEIRRLIKTGYKEIVLIAQNVNSYRGKSSDGLEIRFPELLSQVADLSGKFWVRFASSHPKDLSDELIKVIGNSAKVCPHLHLAVQSGDDAILKAMNRKYTVAHYKKLIKKVRAIRPGISITTDVIVGFPGETRKQFLNTIKLFKEVKFDLAYIGQYSPRPGTVSYKMKDNVRREEKRRRAQELNEALKITADINNKAHQGEIMEVLVEGRNERGQYYGKASNHQTVLSELVGKKKINDALIGNFVKVKIDITRPFGLKGKIICEQKK
ncbi:MAG: tRNA (N6-isopentenyl adenosine(37)-C2)-methylthiotransferase MiaB [Patescibacteria group bacterium]|jgi:tRNA-2-methylthio-N6-dimethylallyladenosine synthase